MRLIRSWPASVPPGRAHVVDDIERLVMDGYDYRCLDAIDDDVVLIEWDIAVAHEHLVEFMRRAAAEPARVRVAPYRLYQSTTRSYTLPKPLWPHRIVSGVPPLEQYTFVQPGDLHCHLFALGLTYLPRHLVAAWLAANPDEHFSDVSFSGWHYRHAEHRDVPIDWDCPAVHLHYATPEVPCSTR